MPIGVLESQVEDEPKRERHAGRIARLPVSRNTRAGVVKLALPAPRRIRSGLARYRRGSVFTVEVAPKHATQVYVSCIC